MKKLSKHEMKNVKGGTAGILWTCLWVGGGGSTFQVCQNTNPALHTDPTCDGAESCTAGPTCPRTYMCP
jgi:bacteriocin-like protein